MLFSKQDLTLTQLPSHAGRGRAGVLRDGRTRAVLGLHTLCQAALGLSSLQHMQWPWKEWVLSGRGNRAISAEGKH